MNKNEIIEMADKAGFFVNDNEAYSPSVQEDHELTSFLEAFAKLVAAAERKEWAQEFAEMGEWTCVNIMEQIDK